MTIAVACTFLAACASKVAARTEDPQQAKVNPDALVLVDFKDRVTAYLAVHKAAEKDAPSLKETSDPAKIRAAQQALAENIRAARVSAKQGDIFTPAIRTRFRQLMYPELKGTDGPETKQALKEDAPAAKEVPLKVNALYPETAPLSTVPPNILANLPQLPEELEYRVVGRTLILRDVHANIIVDFIPNAIV
jgi:hypothetical protein